MGHDPDGQGGRDDPSGRFVRACQHGPMTAKFIVGDVYEQMGRLEDGSFDLVMCSPPFYNLRSYLPKGHPDKAKEIGQERTPGEYIDKMLRLAALARAKMTRFGSFAIEIGDT